VLKVLHVVGARPNFMLVLSRRVEPVACTEPSRLY